jgi:hypothetical protein
LLGETPPQGGVFLCAERLRNDIPSDWTSIPSLKQHRGYSVLAASRC